MTNLISRVRKSSASVASSAENSLGKRKTARVPRGVRVKPERSESVFRSSGDRWYYDKGKSSGCCEHDSDVRTVAMERAGGDTHRTEGLMLVRQYALN